YAAIALMEFGIGRHVVVASFVAKVNTPFSASWSPFRSAAWKWRRANFRRFELTERFDPLEFFLGNWYCVRLSKIVQSQTIGFARRIRRNARNENDTESEEADLQRNIGRAWRRHCGEKRRQECTDRRSNVLPDRHCGYAIAGPE